MNPPKYEIPENLTKWPYLDALLRLEDALGRLDERARLFAHREGWQARLLYHNSVASLSLQGELVDLEDLITLDGGVYRGGAVSPELSSAWHTLSVWQAAVRGDAGALLRSDRPG